MRKIRASAANWMMLGVTVAAATASAIALSQFRAQADSYRQTQLLLARTEGSLYKLHALKQPAPECAALSRAGRWEWDATKAGLAQQANALLNLKDNADLQHVAVAIHAYVAEASPCETAAGEAGRRYMNAVQELNTAMTDYDKAARESIWRSEVEGALGLLAFVFALAAILWRLGSARRKAEFAAAEAHVLERSDRRFRTLTERSSDLIAILDESGALQYLSSSVGNVLGYNEERPFSSSSLLEIIHPDDKESVLQALRAVAQTQQSRQIETRCRHANGTWRTFEFIVSNGFNTDGINGLVVNGRDITERKRTEEKLVYDAFHDALTGLPNRALFLERLQRAVNRARRDPEYHYAVLFIDVDRFKLVNDSLGHNAGDRLLIEIAARLNQCIRQTTPDRIRPAGDDTLGRLGGDEFTILVEELRETVDADRVAQRILSRFDEPFEIEGTELYATASIGIAMGSPDYHSADDVMRDADIAMYQAKAVGGARVQIFDAGMQDYARSRLQLETDLRHAVERNELRVFLQPIVSLENGTVVSVEALVRWEHPERGLLPPAEFIHVAEDTGLIVQIGRWVMREACLQLRALQDFAPRTSPRTVSVNLSAKEFAQPNLVEEVREALAIAKLPPSALRIEITETVAMTDVERVEKTLGRLKELGVGLSIDDFGTGYSSLSYLKRFPVDTLKIDRSFVMTLNTDHESREIVRTILNLASNLKMDVVAEGTETPAQIAALQRMNCKYAQGYYYSPPVARGALEKVLERHAEPSAASKTAAK
ncbi:MAG: putative bifunctional diguanylate cyclase/phosphodiesterase [Terriglobales bacterium]